MIARRPDMVLVSSILVLLVAGIAMLSSASSVVAFEKFQDGFYFVTRQMLMGVLPGLVFLLLFSFLDYHIWARFAFPLFIISLLLLVAVFIPGIGASYGRAQSWIAVGGFSFQPSEIAKLVFLIYLAAWCAKRREDGVHASFVPFLFLVVIMAVLLTLQPDVGTMTVVILSAVGLYFVAGAKWAHLALLAVGGLLGLLLLIQVAPYRAARLSVFLQPELDPQGIGYQINQASLAIGSGGLLGRGFGMSRQKFLYLPEVISDSIFAVIAEELGFFFTVALIGVFMVFAFRGLAAATRAPDVFGKLLASGITFVVMIQAFANMGSMVGLLPITGLPLPLISYGGSSMVTTLASMGILINISRHAT